MKKALHAVPVWLGIAAAPMTATADSGETTRELNGTNITYLYSSGRSYNVKFEEAGVSYRYLVGVEAECLVGAVPYQAMRVGPDVYFASWFEKGYGDHVTLLVDFAQRVLFGSALIVGEEVHFHRARILEMSRP